MPENSIHVKAQRLLSCRDIIQCVFDLNEFEIKIYRYLTSEGPKSAEEIGKIMGKNRSTAYRALRQLTSCRIVYKKTITLDKGGHQHIYYPVEPEKVRDEMKIVLEEWIKKMRKAVQTFPEDMIASLDRDGI
jgi:predicted transcriptional regulator